MIVGVKNVAESADYLARSVARLSAEDHGLRYL